VAAAAGDGVRGRRRAASQRHGAVRKAPGAAALLVRAARAHGGEGLRRDPQGAHFR